MLVRMRQTEDAPCPDCGLVHGTANEADMEEPTEYESEDVEEVSTEAESPVEMPAEQGAPPEPERETELELHPSEKEMPTPAEEAVEHKNDALGG